MGITESNLLIDACETGNIDDFKNIVNEHPDMLTNSILNKCLFVQACCRGQLHIAQWLFKKKSH
jgi:hypothetical protein